jgi:nucleotide-binding universal stress UspA family protein
LSARGIGAPPDGGGSRPRDDGGMERIAVTVRLNPGCEDRARELLRAGPPFEPRGAGLRRHDVYLGPELVVFVFEGAGIEERLSQIVNDRLNSASFSAWAPLLAEPPRLAHESFHWFDKEETMETIVIATDGSEPSQEAVELGLELAAEQEATPFFVHVIPDIDVMPTSGLGISIPPAIVHEPTDEDRAPLDDALRLATERGMEAKAELLTGSPAAQIVAYADSVGADMIVIGSRGHGRIASAVLGSVSRGVLATTQRPVLVVRAARSRVEAAIGS